MSPWPHTVIIVLRSQPTQYYCQYFCKTVTWGLLMMFSMCFTKSVQLIAISNSAKWKVLSSLSEIQSTEILQTEVTTMVRKVARSRTHQATRMTTTMVYPCSIGDCQFRAQQRNKLEKHVGTEHTGAGTFHCCDICDFRGASSEDLEFHQKGLHDGRIYSCPTCEIRFNKKSRLFTHYRRNHDEDTIHILYDIWLYMSTYQIIISFISDPSMF